MITSRLLEFIQKEQSIGTSRENIIATLRAKGWKDADIDSALKTLSDEGPLDVPVPREGILPEFRDMLFLMWGVYRSRWKRFVGVGIVYFGVALFLSLALYMFVLPAIPTFLGLVLFGNTAAAFSLIVPYLLLVICGYVLVELWYVATLYSVALRKGDSLLERLETGLRNLPAILGIKIAITLLLLISFTPLLAVVFLTQNLLVLVVFGPLFIIGALFLGFLFSLALPAYFHGVPWKEATLHSMRIVFKNALSIFLFYVCFAVVLILASAIFRHTGPIAVCVAIGLFVPMETLFMITLYRRFVGSDLPPRTRTEVAPVLPPIQLATEAAPAATVPTTRPKRTRKSSKALPA